MVLIVPNCKPIMHGLPWMRILQIVLDVLLISASFFGAFLIRFDARLVGPQQGFTYVHQLQYLLIPVVTARIISNWLCGVYRRLWRYTGLTEIMELMLAVLSVTALLFLCRAFSWLGVEGNQLSYGIIAIDGGLCFMLLTAPRVLRRLQTEHDQRRHWRQPVSRRALLIGAGDAGQLVLRELINVLI